MKNSDGLLILALFIIAIATSGCDKKTKAGNTNSYAPSDKPAAVRQTVPTTGPSYADAHAIEDTIAWNTPVGVPGDQTAEKAREEVESESRSLVNVRKDLHEIAKSAVSLRTALLQAKLTAGSGVADKPKGEEK